MALDENTCISPDMERKGMLESKITASFDHQGVSFWVPFDVAVELSPYLLLATFSLVH
jgi:hypothetical protein